MPCAQSTAPTGASLRRVERLSDPKLILDTESNLIARLQTAPAVGKSARSGGGSSGGDHGCCLLSTAGELVFHVFAATAHFGRRLISGRTGVRLAAARRRGSQPGHPPVDPEKAAALRKLVDAGLTLGRSVRQLSIGRSTACRIIREKRGEGKLEIAPCRDTSGLDPAR